MPRRIHAPDSADRPLDLVSLLEDTALFGGVKIVLLQANLMADRGHRVTVVGPGESPRWYALRCDYLRTTGLEPHEIPPADLVIATFWTTIDRAVRAVELAGRGQAVHFCQGFEGWLDHNEAEHAAIDEAYARPVPAITVSPHLAEWIRDRFSRPATVIAQPLEATWRPRRRLQLCPRPGRRPRVLATGPWEIELKGVRIAADAVRLLRDRGHEVCWVRLSQWPLSDAERAVLEPDEFHHHLRPDEVPALVGSCDLLLAPSSSQEGFGLPVLEAMAAGVPVVATDVASFRAFAHPAAVLVEREAAAFADAAETLLREPGRWRRRRREGLRLARRHHADRVAPEIEAALRWAAAGGPTPSPRDALSPASARIST